MSGILSVLLGGSKPAPKVFQYLIIAGGGSGGGPSSAGTGAGGAGGYLEPAVDVTFAPGQTYTISIGAGGSAQSVSGSNSTLAGPGFSTVTTYGGGRGGEGGDEAGADGPGQAGGSGGGAGRDGTGWGYGVYPGSPYISAERQGYNGGNGTNSGYAGGGGGGAGQDGGSNSGNGTRGQGGIGVTSPFGGSSVGYAGGGGAPGAGGATSYGGGNPSSNGTANTGGGGGAYALGGSGICIIRYSDALDAAASTTGAPTITASGGYRYYKFTGSGSITF